jgi:hypothetical protein
MDMSALGVIDKEVTIAAMFVGLVFQVSAQFKNVLLEILLKRHHVFFASLATFELVPCQKQILWVDNFCK